MTDTLLSPEKIELLETIAASKYASKQKQKQTEAKQSIIIGDKKHVAVVTSYKARNIANNAQKQRVHRSLQLAKHTIYATVVCEETGIVSLLEIPAIQGFALTYNHPLSDLGNSRGLAQQGKDYLRKLDMQVLAGILIVLAADYSLFCYQPSDSGAQKNAILRTVQKDTLINAILTVEDMIHSSNHSYLPKLSLILDTRVEQGGIENRMQAWLKLIVEAIYKPDTETWDENETAQRNLKIRNKEASKERMHEESILRKEQKILKDDLKSALCLIKDLFKAEQISGKMRIFLGGVFQEFQLLTMEEGARALLANKLSDIDSSDAFKLLEILNKERKGLVAKNTPMDDFFSDCITGSASDKTEPKLLSNKASRVVAAKDEFLAETIFNSVEIPLEEVPEGLKRIFISGKPFLVAAQQYETMSFMEKIKFHKALLSGAIKNNGETK